VSPPVASINVPPGFGHPPGVARLCCSMGPLQNLGAKVVQVGAYQRWRRTRARPVRWRCRPYLRLVILLAMTVIWARMPATRSAHTVVRTGFTPVNFCS
jgi:hypothetical protein